MNDATNALLAGSSALDINAADQRRFHDILGVRVWATTAQRAVAEIERILNAGGHRKLSFLNAHGANIAREDPAYCRTLEEFLVLSDGIGLDLGARILYGAAFPENLNGTDFVPELFTRLERGLRITLLGARPGIAQAAAERFAFNHPQHQFSVLNDGYFDATREKELLRQLEQERPDILLVAFGNPRQEQWIAEHCTSKHAGVCIGVGALFDFMSGSVKRAPKSMINMRLEWLYRLWLEPGRMWRRYVLGNPLFIVRILRQKLFGSRDKQGA